MLNVGDTFLNMYWFYMSLIILSFIVAVISIISVSNVIIKAFNKSLYKISKENKVFSFFNGILAVAGITVLQYYISGEVQPGTQVINFNTELTSLSFILFIVGYLSLAYPLGSYLYKIYLSYFVKDKTLNSSYPYSDSRHNELWLKEKHIKEKDKIKVRRMKEYQKNKKNI